MKKSDTGVIPECYVDTNLMDTLTGVACNHQKGCANVAKVMKEKCADRFALGVIDKDKRSVSYIDEFDLIAWNDSIEVLKHKERPHYIIYVVPAVEAFILKLVDEQGVNLAEFGLPCDLDALKNETKQRDSLNDSRFTSLFKALSENKKMQTLREVVKYLREHPYNADTEVIREMFCE